MRNVFMMGQGVTHSVRQACACLCVGNAAYQGFEERHKGSITPGKLADFVVLEENPLTVEPLHIKDIVVAATIVGNTLRYGSL